MNCGSPVGKVEIGDPSGIPLFSFYGAFKWHKDVSSSSSPVLLE